MLPPNECQHIYGRHINIIALWLFAQDTYSFCHHALTIYKNWRIQMQLSVNGKNCVDLLV